MINSVIKTEIEYRKDFSEHIDFGDYIRFWDDHLKTMYAHNNILIKPGLTQVRVYEIIEFELEHRKNNRCGFLNVYSDTPISPETLERFSMKPVTEKYLYLGINTSKGKDIKVRENAILKVADNDKIRAHGHAVDVIANYKHMTLAFAIERINRKFKVYDDKTKNTNFYVCYNGDEPVGNCELFLGDGIAKIEDFDIIEDHQRKGFGSFVLSSLLKICEENNVSEAYLVTDLDDTAKEMYYKCGFEDIGYYTSLMFSLDK